MSGQVHPEQSFPRKPAVVPHLEDKRAPRCPHLDCRSFHNTGREGRLFTPITVDPAVRGPSVRRVMLGTTRATTKSH